MRPDVAGSDKRETPSCFDPKDVYDHASKRIKVHSQSLAVLMDFLVNLV